MKLKISTIFLLAAFVSIGLLGFYSINGDQPNDLAPTVSEVTQNGNIQADTTPPGGFYPTMWNYNYSLIGGQNGGTVGGILWGGKYYNNRWNSTTYYRINNDGPGGGPGTVSDSGTYVGAVRDMTIGMSGATEYLFGGAASSTLYKLNATLGTVGTFSVGGAQFRMIAYDPNRKGFWNSNFSGNIICHDTSGAVRGTVVSTLTGKYGAGWDSGNVHVDTATLWIWDQGTGTNSSVVKYRLSGGAGTLMNTYTFGQTAAEIAGGAEIVKDGGNLVLILNWQNYAITGYKLASMGGGGGSLCFNRGGIWVSIPDNMTGTARDTIKVPNNMGTLDDITVVMDTVIHTWVGDLIFDLSHGGQVDTLFAWMGTGSFGNSGDNLFGIALTDSSNNPIVNTNGSNTVPPPAGQYLAGGRTGVDSLKKHFVRSGGAASEMNGNWVLTMHDRASGDTGSLRAWHICFYSGNIAQIISNNNQTPDRYVLGQNYPNPFNPSTKINFSIPKAGLVSLRVYDMLGREVKTLVADQLSAGEFAVDFDGSNLSSGTYFYRLQVGDFVEVKKMVLLK